MGTLVTRTTSMRPTQRTRQRSKPGKSHPSIGPRNAEKKLRKGQELHKYKNRVTERARVNEKYKVHNNCFKWGV